MTPSDVNKFRTIVGAYQDGLLTWREALYQLVDLPGQGVPKRARDQLCCWLNGDISHTEALRACISEVAFLSDVAACSRSERSAAK